MTRRVVLILFYFIVRGFGRGVETSGRQSHEYVYSTAASRCGPCWIAVMFVLVPVPLSVREYNNKKLLQAILYCPSSLIPIVQLLISIKYLVT